MTTEIIDKGVKIVYVVADRDGGYNIKTAEADVYADGSVEFGFEGRDGKTYRKRLASGMWLSYLEFGKMAEHMTRRAVVVAKRLISEDKNNGGEQ